MLVYISVCSLIGSISVVFTQGLGSAIVHSITYKEENQFKNWFIYLVLAIVIVTLVIEIVYLNKALNLFNTALVTPTYYVIFTTMTIVSSIVLYRGFDASPVDVATCVLGFLSICSGVALLHNSRSDLENSKSALEKKVDDDEKILLDEQPVVRRKSVFQMFENKSEASLNENIAGGHHGSQNPGAADLFPAPFSGISRYASTTKRSQSILTKHRLKSAASVNVLPVKNEQSVKTRPHSNTISIGNTEKGEEGYDRELRWREHNNTNNITTTTSSPLDLSSSPGQYHSSNDINEQLRRDEFVDQDLNEQNTTTTTNNTNSNAFSSVFTRKHSASVSSTTHRAQNDLNPLSTYKLQINGGELEDRKGLVSDDWTTR